MEDSDASLMSDAREHRREYARRMNRVLDHIDAHLDAPLELAALAELAHFSPFHFHRLFTAWTGETLGAYLQRRRLEAAAQGLTLDPQRSVLQLALAVGFGSGEAFARAFKLHFGCTPSAWRAGSARRWADYVAGLRRQLGPRLRQQDSKLDQDGAAAAADDEALFHTDEPWRAPSLLIMQVEIKTLAPQRIAYMRHIGPYGPTITQFWYQRFLPWLQAEGLDQRPSYGIGHDDPGITPPQHCRYDAAVAVDAGFETADRAVSFADLPGGLYAMARFRGDGREIGTAWAELFREWLPASGYQCDGRPCFELYDEPNGAEEPDTGVFRCWLCIPVKR
jgi:AraC family transcriptional regulator